MNRDEARFFEKFIPEPNSGCWLWTGAICKGNAGYGQMRWKGKTQSAHRVSFEIHKGILPSDLDICHTCDVPSCVNPDHLFSGTRSENMVDCVRKGRFAQVALASKTRLRKNRFRQELKTSCPSGHPYDAGNTYTYIDKDGGKHRHCIICRAIHKENYRGRI